MWSLGRPDPVWIKTDKQIRKLKEQLENKRICAIDSETTGLEIYKDTVLFWSLSTGDDRYFLEANTIPAFAQVFRDPNRIWIGTHTKYDAHMFANSGYPLEGELRCTLVMDRLNDPDNDHGLKEVYEREFGEKVRTFGEVFYPRNKTGKPQKPKGLSLQQILLGEWENNPDSVVDYASLDAWMSYRVYKLLQKKLKDVTTWRGNTLWDIYKEWEIPFTRVLYECERRGVKIDEEYLQNLKPKMEDELKIVERKLNKLAGRIVNLNSPKQLVELFTKRGYLDEKSKKTKGGQLSVDVSVLTALADKNIEEAKLVLRSRKITKTLGTYVDGILEKLDSKGRLHGTLNQHVTETWRLSSDNPNLQNLPRSDSDEFKIRKSFIATKGYKLVDSDYDQLEMFLMAHFSIDPNMIRIIKEGKDIHAGNAALVWNEKYEEIVAAKKKDRELSQRDLYLREIRQFAKVVGFGQHLGRSKTCSKRLNPIRAIPCCIARCSVSTWKAISFPQCKVGVHPIG